MSALHNLHAALKKRLTHRANCAYWKDKKDCDCGFNDLCLEDELAKDLKVVFNQYVAPQCEFCKTAPKHTLFRAPDGYYHRKIAENELTDFCDNTPFWIAYEYLTRKKT